MRQQSLSQVELPRLCRLSDIVNLHKKPTSTTATGPRSLRAPHSLGHHVDGRGTASEVQACNSAKASPGHSAHLNTTMDVARKASSEDCAWARRTCQGPTEGTPMALVPCTSLRTLIYCLTDQPAAAGPLNGGHCVVVKNECHARWCWALRGLCLLILTVEGRG